MFKVTEVPELSFPIDDSTPFDSASVSIRSGGCRYLWNETFNSDIKRATSFEDSKEYGDRDLVQEFQNGGIIMGEKNPPIWHDAVAAEHAQLFLWTNTSISNGDGYGRSFSPDGYGWSFSGNESMGAWHTSYTKPVLTKEGTGKIAPPPVKEDRTNLKKVLEWLLEGDNAQLLEEAVEYAETIIECPEV